MSQIAQTSVRSAAKYRALSSSTALSQAGHCTSIVINQATYLYQVIVLCFAANIPGPRSTCGRNERAVFRRWCEGSSWYSRSGALLTAKHRLSMVNLCFAVT